MGRPLVGVRRVETGRIGTGDEDQRAGAAAASVSQSPIRTACAARAVQLTGAWRNNDNARVVSASTQREDRMSDLLAV
jgi:hypothetical protein